MDPNATVRDLRSALEAGDLDAAKEAAENLRAWIRKGGFLPDGMTRDSVLALISQALDA
jgi:hypothetical protein